MQNKEPMEKSDGQRKSVLEFFASNPVIGLISSIGTIVGIALSIYFFLESREYRELSYFIYPAKAILVKSGQTSKLLTTYENKIIKSDVTVAQIAVWNKGKLSIKKNNILTPIVIETENKVPILEASIRKATRDVLKLSLNTDQMQSGQVTLFWEIMEQDDGGIIQIIYEGNPDIKFFIKGDIEGQKEGIRQIKFSGKIRSPQEQIDTRGFWKRNAFIYIMPMIFFVPFIINAVVLILKKKSREIINAFISTLKYVAIVAAGLLIVALLFEPWESGIPFSF